MSKQRAIRFLVIMAVLSAAASCDTIDRARSRFGTTDTLSVVTTSGTGLLLALQTPSMLHPGEEGVLRLSINNRSDTTVRHIRLELIVPGWAEPMPPRAGDREVSMVAVADVGTRFAYRMDETPLAPGATQFIEQRIRIPATASQPNVPWSRVVRARLLRTDGEPLAEVEGQIALDSAAVPDTIGTAAIVITRDQIGPVTLGMTAAALRQAVPSARDTTWRQGGVPQRGVSVPLRNNGQMLAVLSGDSVIQLEVRDPAVRTRERLGVGSRLEELRAAYGVACADAGEGSVVVWFARAPGISFALDMPVPANVAQLRANPDRLPGTARVGRWWLRRGVDSCKR